MNVERLVGENGPRRGGPNNNRAGIDFRQSKRFCKRRAVCKRKRDVNSWVLAICVFDLGFSQCRAAIKTPIHRLESTENIALF